VGCQPDAEPAFVPRYERFSLILCHARKVVDIQIALAAKPHAVSADHLFRVSLAGRSDSHAIQKAIESGHNISPVNALWGNEVRVCLKFGLASSALSACEYPQTEVGGIL
jgi:hypothetical protein